MTALKGPSGSPVSITLVSDSLFWSSDDLDSEIMINTPPAPSIESGVESLTHSLSRLDSSSSSPHGHTPDFGRLRVYNSFLFGNSPVKKIKRTEYNFFLCGVTSKEN